MRKQLSLMLVIAAIVTGIPLGEPNIRAAEVKNKQVMFGVKRENTYQDYLNHYKNVKYPQQEIVIPAASYSASGDAQITILNEYEGKRNVLKWTNQEGWVEWTVEIPEDGLYHLGLSYYPLPAKSRPIELRLDIDGEMPFESARQFMFNRVWKDDAAIKQDNQGNDIRARQVEAPQWREEDLKDTQGLYNGALFFHFTKGRHTVRLTCSSEAFILGNLKIYNKKPLPEYKEVKAAYTKNGFKPAKDAQITVQAETPYLKSDSMLIPMYDKSSAATQPFDPTRLRLNTIGRTNWQNPGQWITWKFEVPEDGLYKIGIRATQSLVRGLSSSRKIRIDGEVPFKELESVKFPYDSDWYMKVLGEEDPYLFYFTKGTHQLTMEVTLGDVAETLRVMEECVYQLNYIYRKILMITGSKPDLLRDYYLEKEIPDLLPSMQENSSTLSREADRLEGATGKSGSEAALLRAIAAQMDSFVAAPDTIPGRLDKFKSNVSSLSSWILKLKEQPLEIDYITVLAPEKQFPKAKAAFVQQFKVDIQAFFSSFTHNYAMIGDVHNSEKSITVWVNGGRDQAQVIKGMIDDLFTPKTGIQANLSLVESALVEATLAGKGPDVALHVANSEPVNLAIRGALTDLSQFPDFQEVNQRFNPQAIVPYEFQGKYYALPVTQNFNMMFYRKDIFDELGIKAPQTWEEFYSIIPFIQKNNMTIGLPAIKKDNKSVDSSSTAIFETLLWQYGGAFYKPGLRETALDQPEALQAFQDWVGFYNRFKFPLNYDFYNRFRTGEMPLAVEPYTMFNKLSVAAPEIRGLWDMVPVPGTRKPGGKLDRSVAASGTGTVMFSKTKDKEAAWEFMKWWTGAEAQARYGRELEALMGTAARYDTANIEAFGQLPWSPQQYKTLISQWNEVKEMPQVPGSYYVSRHLANAFRRVNFYWENPRETLFHYNKEINKEIQRKREEFGLDIPKGGK